MRRTKVTHIGSTKFHSTFDWANTQDTLTHKMVLSIGCVTQPDSTLFAGRPAHEVRQTKQGLDDLHLDKIAEAHEVLVLNLTGYIGASTLHELCYAHNQQKRIRWLEEWPMYCQRCGIEGPEAVHFFHNALSLDELNTLLIDEDTHDYLPGQLVNWYGQIVPVVRLAYGVLALQVDLNCPVCGDRRETCYATASDDGTFCQLSTIDEEYLADLRDADERAWALVCAACLMGQSSITDPLRRLTVRCADNPSGDVCKVVPVSSLPPVVRPLAGAIAAYDFERLVLRRGLTEITITNGEDALSLVLSLAPSPFPARRAIPWQELTAFALGGQSTSAEERELLAAATQLYQETGRVPARLEILARIRQNVAARDGESAIAGWNRKKWPWIAVIC